MIPRLLLAAGLAALPVAAGLAVAATPADICESQAAFTPKGATVIDRRSGLEWQRCALGRHWNGKGCSGEARLQRQAEAMQAGARTGKGWRLPTVAEIAGLLDPSCPSVKVPLAMFPDIDAENPEGDPYWTSTPVGMAGLWYFADLQNGDIDGHSPDFSLQVRLVR